MNIDKPCHNSSCELTATGRRSKKAHGVSLMQRSLWPRIFFDVFFLMQRDFKRICKRDRLRLLRKWRMKNEIKQYFILDKASVAHLPDSISVRKKTFAYIFKLNTNFPNQTNHFICRLNLEKIRLQSLLSCQGTIKIKRKSKEKNQKTDPWKDSV